MADAEDIADLKEEIRKNIGPVKNHCPFGCATEELDEHGYCRHLVGFTNTVQVGAKVPVGAVVEPIIRHPVTEMTMVNGRHKRKATNIPPSNEVVKEGDKLVNPEEVQIVNGVRSVAKMWVSSRVYREQKAEQKKAS